MFKFIAALTGAALSGISAAWAHPSAIAHTHPHEPVSLFSPQALAAVALGLAIGGAFAFVRLGRGK